jgi:soluble lytic murein transglycosylase-like protein
MTSITATKLLSVIAAVFALSITAHPHPRVKTRTSTNLTLPVRDAVDAKSTKKTVRKLAGPYAHMVLTAARKAHVPAKLVAAVVQVENGGDFHGSTTRVSSAGAIGVMQLEPNTAWNGLHVNPWNARENIDGGARYLADMLRQFHGDVRMALMAYNAGPSAITHGWHPYAAVAYAKEVMRDEKRGAG